MRRQGLELLAVLAIASGFAAAPALADPATATAPLDRYGGGRDHPVPQLPPESLLTWSGKAAQAAPAPATPLPAASAPAAPRASSAPSAPQGLPAPPDRGATRTAWSPGGPRFYSVHRQYGLEPSAIPLPPQFFGATADLSQPPPDQDLRRTVTGSGQVRTSAAPQTQDSGQ